MSHKVTLIPGDGIGPEVTNAVVRILEATGIKFEWETFVVGAEAYEKYGEYIPKDLIASLERTRVGLKGRELVERLTEMRSGIKVLYMSAYTEDAAINIGVLNPGTEFIEKPFGPDELASKVRHVLARSQTIRS